MVFRIIFGLFESKILIWIFLAKSIFDPKGGSFGHVWSKKRTFNLLTKKPFSDI